MEHIFLAYGYSKETITTNNALQGRKDYGLLT